MSQNWEKFIRNVIIQRESSETTEHFNHFCAYLFRGAVFSDINGPIVWSNYKWTLLRTCVHTWHYRVYSYEFSVIFCNQISVSWSANKHVAYVTQDIRRSTDVPAKSLMQSLTDLDHYSASFSHIYCVIIYKNFSKLVYLTDRIRKKQRSIK